MVSVFVAERVNTLLNQKEFTSVTRYCGQLLLCLLHRIETNAVSLDRKIFAFYGSLSLTKVLTGVRDWSLP